MSRTWLFVGITLCGLVVAWPVLSVAQQDKTDFSGKYAVEGKNPDGSTYRGTVQITKKGETYRIDWLIGANDVHQGIGLMQGNILACSYASNDIAGIVMYRLEKGPKLVGRWAIQGGNGQVFSETLTKTN